MNKVKEYKTFKTASKTATQNNLTQGKKDKSINCLLDFSILDSSILTDIEKQIIINSAIRSITPSNKVDYYGNAIDNFTACDGISNYNCHKVFSITGKFLYCIMELANIKHYTKNRNSIYDNYTTTLTTVNSGTEAPYQDLEIA